MTNRSDPQRTRLRDDRGGVPRETMQGATDHCHWPDKADRFAMSSGRVEQRVAPVRLVIANRVGRGDN
jgi:hypothetical protein